MFKMIKNRLSLSCCLVLVLAAGINRLMSQAAVMAERIDSSDNSPTQVICNPLNLSYRFQLDEPSRREAADPTVIFFKGYYFLFASKSGGYWYSPDLADWIFVESADIPVEDYAPTAIVIDDRVYFMASSSENSPIYQSADPVSGKWQLVRDDFPFAVWDPALFLDDDGRLYLYWGCSDKLPIMGIELDRKNFEPIGEPDSLIFASTAQHGWENPGDYNELTEQAPWIEGAWMNKFNGIYYLQYSGPGTEYKSYCDAVYISDKPLGPFVLAEHNPFALKPGGFACGAGHGSTFRDRWGNLWFMGTITISVKHIFERRLGLYPVFLDEDGQLYAYTAFGDYPFYIPKRKIASPADASSGWMLLSYGKDITSSSYLEDHPPRFANDEDIRTFWSAGAKQPGEWLQIDLGDLFTIHAVQVNFAESESGIMGRTADCYYQYKIEHSHDGHSWKTLIDKSESGQDTPHDFSVINNPVQSRHVRITAIHVPDGFFALSGLRVFGKGNGSVPFSPLDFEVKRNENDRRKATLRWDAVENAVGYTIRYGREKSKTVINHLVYNADELTIRSLNAEWAYWFSIAAFNENGVSEPEEAVKVR